MGKNLARNLANNGLASGYNRQQMSDEPMIAGWRERIDLPEWEITGLVAKLDTGARTCALHVEELIEHGDGTIEFFVIIRKKPLTFKKVRCKPFRTSTVRSSNGMRSHRFVVQTVMRLGIKESTVEISLTTRAHMSTRMLIGRTALFNVLVDPSKPFIQS